MGRGVRQQPRRLPEKLLQLRTAFELSQNEMIRKLGLEEDLRQGDISGYELGTRPVPVRVIYEYARVANIWMEVLVDDELDLPAELPTRRKHEGVRRVEKRSRKEVALAPGKRRPTAED